MDKFAFDGKGSKGFKTAKHKLMGHVGGKDKDGNGGVYYSPEHWETLEKAGMATKGEDGWKLKEERGKAKSYISSHPSSADANTNSKTAQRISPATTMPNNFNINTPSNDVDGVNEKPSSESNYNENTPTTQGNDRKSNNLTPEAKQKLDSIDSQSSKELRKEVFREKAVQQQQAVREQLFEATRDGNEAKVAKLSEQAGALEKVIKSIDADQPVKASLAKTAGIPTNHTSSPDGKPFNETVDFESVGDTEKVVQGAKVASDPSNHIPKIRVCVENTPSTQNIRGQVTTTTHLLLLFITAKIACCDTPNTLAIIC